MPEFNLAPPPRLLAVFAHPDDEQRGTSGAHLASVERGFEVHLLTATSGEAGEISDPALATPATLGMVREKELRRACRILGVREPTLLRYRDGGSPPVDFGAVQTVAADEIGTPDEVITTAVPVDRFWDRRWAAFLAHRSQLGADSPFVAVGEDTVRTWLRIDRFRRIRPAPAPGAPLPDEDDLWSGLDLTATAGAAR